MRKPSGGMLRSKVLALFRKRPAKATAALAVLRLEGVPYVFGLDWRLLPPNRRLSRALALAREEGQAWCALSEMEDVVGFLAAPPWLRGKHYSACLHLAARFSQGGLELFALVINEHQHAVLALQESRPLPGFDFLGDPDKARALVEEFLTIQRGQPMRLVGNTDYLEGQEEANPDDLFTAPARSARLRSLRSWRALRRGLVFVLLALAVGMGGERYLEYHRQETLIQLQSSPAYQQKLYQEGLNAAWTSIPPPSEWVLRGWIKLLSGLPLHVQGWRLSHMECQIDLCKAHWLRQHGSYADFLQRLPEGVSGVDEVSSDQNLMAGRLVTHHALPVAEVRDPLARHDLPALRQARRSLADLLQDLQLLDRTVSRVEPAQLFGGEQDVELLVEPVFKGNWSMRHALWVLPSLTLPNFVRVQSLKVDLIVAPEGVGANNPTTAAPTGMTGSGAVAADATEAKPSSPFFEITGSYYAKK